MEKPYPTKVNKRALTQTQLWFPDETPRFDVSISMLASAFHSYNFMSPRCENRYVAWCSSSVNVGNTIVFSFPRLRFHTY
jgi:hypothetical protein